MAKAIATVGTVEEMSITRRIMDLRGMHRHVTWCASASLAARVIIMAIGAMAAATGIRMGMDIPMDTGTVIGTNTVP